MMQTRDELRSFPAPPGIDGVPSSHDSTVEEIAEQLSAAIEHRDWRSAVGLLGLHWSALLDEPGELLDDALRAVPLRAFEHDARAAAVRDIRLHTSADAVDHMLGDVVVPDAGDLVALEAIARSDRALSLLSVVSARMIALRVRGRLARAIRLAELVERFGRIAVVHQPALVTARLPAALLQAGITRGLADDLPGAMLSLRDAYERGPTARVTYVEADAAGKSAFFSVLAGDVDQARRWVERYDRSPGADGWFASRIALTADLARTLIAIESLERDVVEELLPGLDQPVNAEQSWGPGVTFARARAALAWGDRLSAIDMVRRDRARYADWLGESSVLDPLLEQAEVELLLSVGQPQKAAQVAASDGMQPAGVIARARIELVDGSFELAARHAASVLAQPLSPRSRADALAILAPAQLRLSDRRAALQSAAHLRDAIGGSGLRLAGLSVPAQERRLLDLEVVEDAHGARDAFTIIEQPIRITPQQRIVLQGFEKGWSLREIATSAHLSLNTMKTHARGLYQRLGVTNRDEALARAYDAGLL
ncbi:LuxR C-terminal-related transcriptional regulator [Microbacterium oxydans]|uniref:HTH-type transcriptional regulator MalT n=1 Tax=Microbacterium oxydans TaxID=82380 RepID=A0A0F0LGA5_9MICO|nr:LuxR C-terminal-related transcriptional regulator [Microbacterium oxydans]KJL30591.1 HTH-type transcriptional regulator MalT [Microbacterium oxydans]